MIGLLVDSCVLLDIITEDKTWFNWSSETLEKYSNTLLVINPIIYAEVSIGYENIEELEEALPAHIFKRAPLPWEAAFLAAKIFVKYRKAGGQRSLPLPDFYIGAHALIENYHLLTRDGKRFKHYYPKLNMICP